MGKCLEENKKNLKVLVFDMLCVTPFYDMYLTKALIQNNSTTVLASINLHYDPEYYNRYGIERLNIFDAISKFNITNIKLKRCLILAEYMVNILLLSFKMILKHFEIIHVQWMPLVTRISVELWFLKLVKMLNVKIVYTVHNVLPHDTGLKHKKTFEKIYNLVDALICHTSLGKEELVNDFGISSRKIWIIPHGPLFHDRINITIEDARNFLSFPKGRTVVLFFGKIRPYKGLEFLLEAWKKVTDKYANTLLVVVGIGQSAYLDAIKQKIATLGLGDFVQQDFKFIPNDEVPKYFQAADVLVYPYKDVTQSGALLTGMAFGKPIVASSCGGFRETLKNGEAGILVEYGNVNELADALMALLNSPEERERFGNAAAKELNENYSWDRIAKKTLECYHSLFIN